MDVLKVFHDEPAALGDAGAALDGEASRLYLAGTRLPDDGEPSGALRSGLTALDRPALFVEPLRALFAGGRWTRVAADGVAEETDDPAGVLRDPANTAALVVSDDAFPVEVAAPLAEAEGREGLPALVAALGVARAVLVPEPAHHGVDWIVWARGPLRAAFVEALRRHPAPGARRFVVPYARARGEHHFHFERWQLGALPSHVEEL